MAFILSKAVVSISYNNALIVCFPQNENEMHRILKVFIHHTSRQDDVCVKTLYWQACRCLRTITLVWSLHSIRQDDNESRSKLTTQSRMQLTNALDAQFRDHSRHTDATVFSNSIWSTVKIVSCSSRCAIYLYSWKWGGFVCLPFLNYSSFYCLHARWYHLPYCMPSFLLAFQFYRQQIRHRFKHLFSHRVYLSV